MAMLAVLCLPLMMLGFTAIATILPDALASTANPGPHGFSEILYAYTSAAAANNGSAFAGLSGNTLWYNVTLALAMLVGRFFVIDQDHARQKPDEESAVGREGCRTSPVTTCCAASGGWTTRSR